MSSLKPLHALLDQTFQKQIRVVVIVWEEEGMHADLVVIDDNLRSDAECESRANTLKAKLKDPTTQIDVLTTLNLNILIGDRLSMTIPAEGIAATNYDVLSVERTLSENGGFTRSVMNSSDKQRDRVPNSSSEILQRTVRDVQKLLKLEGLI